MVSFKLPTIALVALSALSAVAIDIQLPEGIQVSDQLLKNSTTLHADNYKVEDVEELQDDLPNAQKLQSPNLAVEISTSFPQSEIFGVKLVNGRPTRAVLDVANNEPAPITVQVIGGSLTTPLDTPGAPDPPVVVRNLTAGRYGMQIPAGERETIEYSFATELHPQDLRLNIAAVLQNSEGAVFTKIVYNETVSIVEAPVSIFDPQMYALPVVLDLCVQTNALIIASFSISSWLPLSVALATSFTLPGSRRCFLRSAAVARAASVLSGHLEAVRKLTQLTRYLSLVPTVRLSRVARRHTMKAGSQPSI